MNLLINLSNYMREMQIDYAVCGGSAIDLFIGRKTRPHKDLDVAVFWDDRDKIVQHMLNEGWLVFEPCGREYLHKIVSIDNQKRIKSNIWCVRPDNSHYRFEEREADMFSVEFDGTEQLELDFIEFLFNKRDENDFLFARNTNIKRKLSDSIHKTDEIPFLAPELVLLYKSTAFSNPDYQKDFENTVPLLSNDSKQWLRNALLISFPDGHEWIQKIYPR